ncbi:MAG: prepilin-type N-terminal cleavage/methylation domain-containing protein [Desulfobacterales bacterium]|nr:prepilin-type N-terminal cleavage/methylation domain-containing protein [Desulfobacterales bacterium]
MKNNKGFSLLEVLIGISIFAIGLMGLMVLQISAIKNISFSGKLSEATLIGETKLVDLKNVLSDSDPLLEDDDGDGEDGLGDFGCGPSDACSDKADGVDTSQGQKGIYTVYWNVAPDSPDTGVQTINVIVTWTAKNIQRSIQIRSMRDMLSS